MTSTLSVPLTAEQRAAIRRINAFRQRFGDGHFYLACHAALPLALTPDLLYCLWVNFQQDSHQELLDIPWIAVSDLILSNLCEEVGHELYEMDASIRSELLKQLQHDSRFRLERVRALADFVMAYVEQELDHPDLDAQDLAQVQKLMALAYRQPNEAAHQIALILTQLKLKDKTEWIRMAALLNSLAEPLAAFQPLLDYIRAMAELTRGNLEAATAQMTKAIDASYQVRIGDVNLPIPDVINGKLPKSNKQQDALSTASPNRLQLPLVIAGATVISLLMLIGVQYGLRSLTPQPSPITANSAPQSSSSATSIPQLSATPLSFPPPASPQAVKSAQALPINTQGKVASQPRKTSASSPTVAPSASRLGSNPQSSAPSLDSPIQLLPNPAQSPTQFPSASVQPPSDKASSPSSPTILVTKIDVSGSTVFSSKDFVPITQPLEEKSVTLEELRIAADAITQIYQNRGYITSRAILSDQTILNGVVQIRIIEGSLERIDIEGFQKVDPVYIRQIVQKGASVPLNRDNLEASLRVLQSDPKFSRVEASLLPGTQLGQSILLVRVAEAGSKSPFPGLPAVRRSGTH